MIGEYPEKMAKVKRKSKTCSTTGKMSFSTKKKAVKQAQRSIALSMKGGGAPSRNPYKCPFCGNWHTTKQEQLFQFDD